MGNGPDLHSNRETVAVIGSGVSGLTAAYVLQKDRDVTLFESQPRLGGHAHTHDLTDHSGHPVRVDSGFIVHNRRTYPQLLRLFAELGVATQESEMSMSVVCQECNLQYAGGRGAAALLPSTANLRNTRYLRMLLEVKKFHRNAHAELARPAGELDTLGDFLTDGRYTQYFVDHFILPLVSAVWSCGLTTARRYPARFLFTFLEHHGLLSVTGSPVWRTVTGGSATYVALASKGLTAAHVGVGIREVRRHHDHVEVRTEDDDVQRFDSVVIATHPDEALGLLTDPTASETEILGAIGYSASSTLLHTDASILPSNTRARASWNYLKTACSPVDDQVHLTYDMNRLQRLDTTTPYLVTLNSPDAVDPSSVIAEMNYSHPEYTPESVAARDRLPELNIGRTAFAGAYHGWGFHEDGCASGVRAAAALGVDW